MIQTTGSLIKTNLILERDSEEGVSGSGKINDSKPNYGFQKSSTPAGIQLSREGSHRQLQQQEMPSQLAMALGTM